MKQIWLVRHAQSKSQTGEDKDGRNPELSDLGRQQAQRLIAPLRKLDLDCILISPLKRAWQTYQFSQVHAPCIVFDSRVAESNWGIPDYYLGILPLATPNIAQPDRHHAWLKPAEERAAELVTDLLSQEKERILLFGHWGIFVFIFRAFAGIESDEKALQATMDNAGISLLEIDHETRRYLRFWNDRAHVADLLE
jgi:broad specificity phosphatase PhoE